MFVCRKYESPPNSPIDNTAIFPTCVISKSGIITPIYNSSHELYNPFAVIPCYNLIFMDGKCEMNIEYTFCGLVFRMECGEILILWLI